MNLYNWPPRFPDGALLPLRLWRHALIEASAGTGKTYQTEGLVVRLVAEEDLAIERILVITFTRAATAELRGRVRDRLAAARRVLAGQMAAPAHDDVLVQLDGLQGPQRGEALARVSRALRDYDRAPISTIHGFCQRVLAEQTLAAGESPDPIIQSDAHEIRDRLTLDAVGSLYAHATLPLLESVDRQSLGLASLSKVARVAVAAGNETTDPPTSLGAEATLRDVTRHTLQAAEVFAQAWTEYRLEVLAWLDSPAGKRALNAVRNITGTRAQARPGHQELIQRFPSDREALIDALRGWLENEALVEQPNDVATWLFGIREKWAEYNQGDFGTTPLAPLADRLNTARDVEAGWSMPEFAAWLRTSNDRRCRDAGLLTYDGMIVRLAARLHAEEGQAEQPLRDAIRSRFDAALIDEFQDTDQAQWTIVRRAFFESESHYLYVVGDPKQAIYRFRGANIGVYLSASNTLPHRFVLDENFRSDPDLVEDINDWWTPNDEDEYDDEIGEEDDHDGVGTFLDRRIEYESVDAARPQRSQGLGITTEIRIFDDVEYKDELDEAIEDYLGVSVGVKGATNAEKRERVAEAVALRVFDLLQDDQALIGMSATGDGTGGHRVRPRDIAVLCRTRRECDLVREALADRNVRGVTGTSDSLYETPPAEWLLTFIEAVAAPTSELATRRLALTPLLGWTLRQLADAIEDDATQGEWTTLRVQVGRWGRRWAEAGFAAVFDHLLRTYDVLARLLSRRRGEREGTDLRDLAERLHVAERRMRLGPVGLAQWLRREMAAADSNDESQLRGIESDGDAVVISTVHAAKGLQYPIVLVPFAWIEPIPPPSVVYEPIVYTPRGSPDGARVVDLHPPDAPERAEALGRADLEQQQEAMRLLYVALTRAIHKTIVWYLPTSRYNPWSALETLIGDAAEIPGAVTEPPIEVPLRIVPSPTPRPTALTPWRPTHAPGAGWMVTSYTGLSAMQTAPVEAAADLEPRAEGDAPALDSETESESDEMPAPSDDLACLPPEWLQGTGFTADALRPAAGHAFQGGTRTGEWLHAVFEHLDFAPPEGPPLARDGRSLAALVAEEGRRFGVNDAAQHTLAVALVPGWLDTPLDAHPELGLPADFSLRQVALADRVDEMGFTLSLGSGLQRRPVGGPPPRQMQPDALRAVYQHAVKLGVRSSAWIESLLALPESRSLLPRIAGLLNGFIDLTFRVGDRYYLADYKSNFLRGPESLGERLAHLASPDGGPPRACELHYSPPMLAWGMAHSAYHLQALVYTVALHRLLRQRLGAGYDYDRNVGGHLYLFLRGMKGAGSHLGVWADRWPRAVVEGMDAVFAGATRDEVVATMDASGGTA